MITIQDLARECGRPTPTVRGLVDRGIIQVHRVVVGKQERLMLDDENAEIARQYLATAKVKTKKRQVQIIRVPAVKHLCPDCGRPNGYPVPGPCMACYSERRAARHRQASHAATKRKAAGGA